MNWVTSAWSMPPCTEETEVEWSQVLECYICTNCRLPVGEDHGSRESKQETPEESIESGTPISQGSKLVRVSSKKNGKEEGE